MFKKIYLDAPNVGQLEKKYLTNAIDAGYVSTVGPFIPEFEKKFSDYLNTKKAVSTQSGTTAIYLTLRELGIGPGDEVIVPVLTFIATVNPIIHLGAKPVFVDVDSETWNMKPKNVEKSITSRTKAIVPVHLYGNPCDMDPIMKIAKKANLYIIEDATESLGAKYNDKHTGTFGDFGCFSFNGNKIITTGGGGMIIGNDAGKLKHIKFLTNQGRGESKADYSEVGFNYRMTNIEAALGLAQLEKLTGFLQKKKSFNNIYRKELKNIKSIRFQEESENNKSSHWLTCAIFEKCKDINALKSALDNKGIATRRVFRPLVDFSPYATYKDKTFKNAYSIYEKGLCLPASTLNSEDDICHAARVLKETI